MTSTIERVARAICRARHLRLICGDMRAAIENNPGKFEREIVDGNWGDYCADARAAVAALSSPEAISEGMLDAARDWSIKKYGKPIGNDAACGCWQAMIAAGVRG